jgi:hypothetical protein
MVHSLSRVRDDMTMPLILYFAVGKIYWRRIYEMDI